MSIDPITRYEIVAKVFRKMTGHIAPGKDVSLAASSEPSYEERFAAWAAWLGQYGEVVRLTVDATYHEIGEPQQ